MNRQSAPTAMVSILHPLMLYAATRGVDPPSFLAHFGLESEVFGNIDGRIPLTILKRIWEELPILCNDPDAPFHAAQLAAASTDNTLLTLMFAASPTFGGGLRRVVRYERVQHGEEIIKLHVDEQAVDSTAHVASVTVPPPPAVILFGYAWFMLLASKAAKRDIPVLGVWLRYPEPKNRAQYDAFFGVRVHFGAEQDRLRLPKEVLDWPHPDASARILHVLELHARTIESMLPSSSAMLTSVRAAIVKLLPDGDATLERVAGEVDLAPRTLQRRLEREGKSLREEVDDVRRSLALEYIENPTMSLTDIAFLLGFSEQSAFHRAFVRWTGRTPGDHRRNLRASAPAPRLIRAP